MNGLVLEGGTFRPIFTAGVLDALLNENIYFDYCIAVSAGASNGMSYISKQQGRNLDVLLSYRNDKRYISRRNFFKEKSLFGITFAFETVTNELKPFDYEQMRNYPGQFYAVATNANTGEATYFDGKKLDKKCMIMRATCALPAFFPAISIGDEVYYDGGLADPIPIKKALQDGCDKLLIVLTRTEAYVKEQSTYDRMAAHLIRRKYPKAASSLLSRFSRYNESVQLARQLEKEGKAIIIQPEYPLKSFESSTTKLQQNYNHGYELAMKNMEKIRGLR